MTFESGLYLVSKMGSVIGSHVISECTVSFYNGMLTPNILLISPKNSNVIPSDGSFQHISANPKMPRIRLLASLMHLPSLALTQV